MTRLKKELIKHGIVFQNEGYDDPYEQEREFVAIEGDFIITLFYSNVMPTEIHLFNKRFHFVGSQNLRPEPMLFSEGKTWNSEISYEEGIFS